MWRILLSPIGICLIIGIFLIIAGIVLRIRETMFCTQEVDAECVSVNYHYRHRSNGTGKVKISYPVWRYCWNGQTYFKEDQNGNSVVNYRVGERCTLRIDPNKPERFYRKGMSNAVVTLIVAIVWTGFVLIGMNLENIMNFIMQFV